MTTPIEALTTDDLLAEIGNLWFAAETAGPAIDNPYVALAIAAEAELEARAAVTP